MATRPARSRPAQPRPAQPQAPQPQTAEPQTAQPQAAQPQTGKPPSAQAQPARKQPAQAGPAKGQPAKSQSAKGQPAQARSAKPQSAASAKAQPARPGRPAKPAPSAQPARSGKPARSAQPARSGKPGKAGPPASASPSAERPVPPRELRLAAAIEAVEAVGMLVAAGFSAVATVDGKSYERSSGIALTLIAVGTAALFAALARGLARARPWTRTPVVMFQLAIGIWGVFLLTGHRYEWGVPMLLVAAATLACLFTPASLRALNRPARS